MTKKSKTVDDKFFWPGEDYILGTLEADVELDEDHWVKRRVKERMDAIEEVKKLARDLYVLGWYKIEMSYSGYGDSMDELAIKLENSEDEKSLKTLNASELPAGSSATQIETLLLELLPMGFENNEGGNGTLTVNTKTQKIHATHNTVYLETKTDELEY